jgi:hypothetical protein
LAHLADILPEDFSLEVENTEAPLYGTALGQTIF